MGIRYIFLDRLVQIGKQWLNVAIQGCINHKLWNLLAGRVYLPEDFAEGSRRMIYGESRATVEMIALRPQVEAALGGGDSQLWGGWGQAEWVIDTEILVGDEGHVPADYLGDR